MYNRLTSYILQYLLDNSFDSKADMARQFEMDERNMQRIMKNAETAKGGTVALKKALAYCAQRRIPLGSIIDAFMEGEMNSAVSERAAHGREAFMNLRITRPDHLTAEGVEMFDSMQLFVRKASVKICPYCKVWCNPWSGRYDVNEQHCYIGRIACEISRDVAEYYTKEGERS